MEIEDYIIKDDLTVDVYGGVWIHEKNLDYIPVQFGVVSDTFNCSRNNLTSLKGCPTKVGGVFSCSNNNLISLKHCPNEIGVKFDCSNNNLISLKHCPISAGIKFDCSNNNLTSLEHYPKSVAMVFNCSNNNLISIENCLTKVSWSFDCSNNMIVSKIPKWYNGEDNPSWEINEFELISSRFFDKLKGLDSDTKIRALTDLKKFESEFYNSVAFQSYNPENILNSIQRSKDATGGLFEL